MTDASLKALAGLKKLRWLIASYTRVTQRGVKELEKALLECAILE